MTRKGIAGLVLGDSGQRLHRAVPRLPRPPAAKREAETPLVWRRARCMEFLLTATESTLPVNPRRSRIHQCGPPRLSGLESMASINHTAQSPPQASTASPSNEPPESAKDIPTKPRLDRLTPLRSDARTSLPPEAPLSSLRALYLGLLSTNTSSRVLVRQYLHSEPRRRSRKAGSTFELLNDNRCSP